MCNWLGSAVDCRSQVNCEVSLETINSRHILQHARRCCINTTRNIQRTTKWNCCSCTACNTDTQAANWLRGLVQVQQALAHFVYAVVLDVLVGSFKQQLSKLFAFHIGPQLMHYGNRTRNSRRRKTCTTGTWGCSVYASAFNANTWSKQEEVAGTISVLTHFVDHYFTNVPSIISFNCLCSCIPTTSNNHLTIHQQSTVGIYRRSKYSRCLYIFQSLIACGNYQYHFLA